MHRLCTYKTYTPFQAGARPACDTLSLMAARIQINVVAVGRLRESWWRDAEAEYVKRLTPMAGRVVVVEVADEATPDGASLATEDAIRRREGERLLSKIGERSYVIALDRSGTALTSEAFAARLEKGAGEEGISAVTFLIGGSLGLSPDALARADLTLSFGAFTFPHQLMRVVLLEQVYRAFKINRGEAYHK